MAASEEFSKSVNSMKLTSLEPDLFWMEIFGFSMKISTNSIIALSHCVPLLLSAPSFQQLFIRFEVSEVTESVDTHDTILGEAGVIFLGQLVSEL